MKSGNGIKAAVVVLIMAGIVLLGVFGVPALNLASVADVRTGIDIQGGISVTLEPAEGANPTPQQLEAAKVVIERRLDSQNVFDRNVTIDTVGRRIYVEIPYKSQSNTESDLLASDYNAQKTVVDYIGRTANLTFRPYDETNTDADGKVLISDEILVEGARVADAGTAIENGAEVVTLKFDAEGARQFADATQRYLQKRIAIYMDEDLLTAPTVQSAITSGEAIITGDFTIEEASMLAAQIRSGTMPFRLVPSEMTQITPLLGSGALSVTIRAGLLAFLFVFLFMVIYYRLPGLIAMAALAGMIAATLVIMAGAQITLTLPGIAGIILSIGMSIDANVIIAERIREEMSAGRTVKASIDAGFKNAFTAIFDSNVTTLISAAVLYFLGSGPIKGFAVTLALGVILSFISAVTVSRIFLKAASGLKLGRSLGMYGVKASQGV
ncbi:MAG: protein translocase subunit SecD [Clostridiales bacterium]|jgi:preprotein translocase subunit SecD|nr:protein translocase subunit SecD [Clostridiales bacterium]